MGQLDDYEFQTGASVPPGGEPESSRGALWLVVGAALLVLAAAAAYYVWQREPAGTRAGRDAGASASTRQAQRGSAEPGENIDLPPLDETDPIVRELVRRLSAHPSVAAWLTTDGLLRNFTVVTANIASGRSPSRHLRPLAPQEPFLARGQEGNLTIDPLSYSRYDGIADAVGALDARGTARLYATLKPRIEEAYKELGEPAADFDTTLERAIVELLRVPVVDRPIRLVPRPMTYAYEDSRLESLSLAQRHLLRMGPNNVKIVQEKLREIAGFLGIKMKDER